MAMVSTLGMVPEIRPVRPNDASMQTDALGMEKLIRATCEHDEAIEHPMEGAEALMLFGFDTVTPAVAITGESDAAIAPLLMARW